MPKARVVSLFHGQYLPNASCEDCEWHDGAHASVRRLAQEHTLATGHQTVVVFSTATKYKREEH